MVPEPQLQLDLGILQPTVDLRDGGQRRGGSEDVTSRGRADEGGIVADMPLAWDWGCRISPVPLATQQDPLLSRPDLSRNQTGMDVLEERRGGGVWNPKICAPKIAQINIFFCKFHYEIKVQKVGWLNPPPPKVFIRSNISLRPTHQRGIISTERLNRAWYRVGGT